VRLRELGLIIGKGIKKVGESIDSALTPKAYADSFDDLDGRVDTKTYWTPEKFINEIVNSDKVTYVHWRKEGFGNNDSGDKLVQNLIKDFPEIDRFVIIELSEYPTSEGKELYAIPAKFSNGPLKGVPCGSLFKMGKEFRIKGPPTPSFSYEKGRDDIKQWLSGGYLTMK
jgi:hypothetical protein